MLSVRDYGSDQKPGEPTGEKETDWTDRWFLFADFLDNCHADAIRLTADPGHVGPVSLWDFAQRRYHVAPTFEVFLEIYLADSREEFGDRRMFGDGAIEIND